jgi:transglutaminase-like putative cysteine protease
MRSAVPDILRVLPLWAPLLLLGSVPAPAAKGSGVEAGAVHETTSPLSRSAPLVFHASGDSVLVRFGDAEAWASLTGFSSPDTTFLSPNHDLILRSRTDSVFISRTALRVTVRFVRTADTLSEVFLFETRSAHDLPRYQALLKQYSRFGQTPLVPPPVFDDVPAHDREAAQLRRLFPLDSIAGSGNDLSRMRNLLHWVHERIRWDGSKENPSDSTLAGSIDACVKRGLTMNCGGLAASYAAVCRAVGLTARRIVCLPFDQNDPDCHSVTIVYSVSLQRWVYMDPTFEAYWTDAGGNLLDLQQARKLLADGDTVLVNPEANLNGEARDRVDHLAYMSKNLFRFKAWLDSGAAICLNPCGYDSTGPVPGKFTEDGNSRSLSTDNPDVFWATPRVGKER